MRGTETIIEPGSSGISREGWDDLRVGGSDT